MRNVWKWIAGGLAAVVLSMSGALVSSWNSSNAIAGEVRVNTANIQNVGARLNRIEGKLDRLLERK